MMALAVKRNCNKNMCGHILQPMATMQTQKQPNDANRIQEISPNAIQIKNTQTMRIAIKQSPNSKNDIDLKNHNS